MDVARVTRVFIPAALLGWLVAFSLAVRVVPTIPIVMLPEDEVRLLGVDPYYHLRHTEFAVAHFPDLQRWDVGTHYPRGQRSKTASLFDLGMAGTALLVGRGEPTPAQVRATVAWTPAVLGALIPVLLFGLVRRVAGVRAGLLAGVFLTAYPGRLLPRSLLGFADHHVFEAFLLILATWGLANSVMSGRARERNARRDRYAAQAWCAALLYTAPMAALLFAWNGAPLYLLLAGVAVLAALAPEIWRGRLPDGPAGGLLRYGVALVAWFGGGALLWPDLVLMPALAPLIIGLTVLIGCFPYAHRVLASVAGGRLTSDRVGKIVVASGAFVLVAGVIVASLSRWRGMLPWFAKTPLVMEHAEVGPQGYWSSLGPVGLVALVAPLVAFTIADRERRRGVLFVGLLGVLLAATWWRTRDYGYIVPPFSAALAAAAVVGVVWRTTRLRRWRDQLYLIAVVLAVLPIWPLRGLALPWLTTDQIRSLQVIDEGWIQAMDWLATRTPPPTLTVDARVSPWRDDFHYPTGTYGVLAPWDGGNFVSALGRRAPVVSQEISTEVAAWFLLRDEETAIHYWDERTQSGERVRYVVIDASMLGDRLVTTIRAARLDPQEFVRTGAGAGSDTSLPTYGPAYHESMAARLLLGGGNGLGHLRLVFQSAQRSALYYRHIAETGTDRIRVRMHNEVIATPAAAARFAALASDTLRFGDAAFYGARTAPSVRIFELVAGATLTGSTDAEAVVSADLVLISRADGDTLTYRRTVTAGTDGRFSLTVAHATVGRSRADVRTVGPYRVAAHRPGANASEAMVASAREIQVSEAQVQEGTILDLGLLTASGRERP